MSPPRRVLPNTTYLFTRRCSERRFFLRPDRATRDVFLYALALAAQRFGLRIHAFCAMSNHLHLVLTDPAARLPAFAQLFHSLLARALNRRLRRWESFWCPGSYSAVSLDGPFEILQKSAYTLANPAAAGLVPRGRDWPGAWSDPALVGGEPIVIKRPAAFFDPDGDLPDELRLSLSTPPGFLSSEDFRERLAEVTAGLEREAALELAQQRRRFLGVRRVLAQPTDARPSTDEPHRQLHPTLASHDRATRVAALRALAAFLDGYRQALRAYQRGDHQVLFPAGTYWMRVVLRARCLAPT